MKKNEFTASLISKIKEDLKLEKLSIEENFFDIGGDSILALSYCDYIYDSTGFTLNLHTFFSFSTIGALIDFIYSPKEKSQSDFIPLTTKDEKLRESLYRLNLSQRLTFNFSMANPLSCANNLTTALKLNWKWHPSDFESSLLKLAKTYDILRTQLIFQDSVPYLFDSGTPQYQTHYKKLNSQEVHQYIQEDILIPIDLKKNTPLLQFNLIETEDHSILYTKFHHILIDGLSNLELFNQLFAFKEKLVLDFKDFIQYESRYQSSLDYKRDEEFWNHYTQVSIPDIIKLDLNQSSALTLKFKLKEEQLQTIQALAQHYKISHFQIILGLHSLVLFELMKKDKLSIGIPTHGRIKANFFNSLGNFINTLPTLFQIHPYQSLDDYFNHIISTLEKVLTHQRFSTAELVEMTSKKGITHLYESIFSYLDLTKVLKNIPTSQFEIMDIERKDTFSPLDTYFQRTDKGIEVCLEVSQLHPFKTEILQYENALTTKIQIINDALQNQGLHTPFENSPQKNDQTKNREFSSPSIIEGEELNEINQDLFYERIIHQLRNNTVEVEDEDEKLNSSDFAEEIGSIQNQIQELSSKYDFSDGIILLLDRKLKSTALQLALIFEGITFIPVDPDLPNNRIQRIIEVSQAKYAINLTSCSFALSSVQFINLDLQRNTTSSFPRAKDRDLKKTCYILFTSGSTGSPKGVKVSYENLNYFLQAIDQALLPDSPLRFLAHTTFSFDITFLEYLYPLYRGGYFYLANKKEKLNLGKFTHLLNEKDITYLQATPSFWKIIISHGWMGKSDLVALSGGETLERKLANDISKKTKALLNMYGPTETTIWSSFAHIDSQGPINLGSPLPGTSFYLLNQEREISPCGETGEIYISSKGISEGYLNDPKRSLEAFVEIKINDESLKLYKTGDFALYDGQHLFYKGRRDNQLKINGHRVELDEIKYHVKECLKNYSPITQDIELITWEDQSLTRLLLFFEIAKENQSELDLTEFDRNLKRDLRARLPSYMIPSDLIPINDYPLNTSGKRDHRELKKIAHSYLSGKQTPHDIIVKEDGSLSRLIYDICADVLQLKQKVEPKDHFFSLGGNSITALEYISKIEDIFSVSLSLNDFYQLQSLEGLNDLIHLKVKANEFMNQKFKYLVNLNGFDPNKESIFFIHGVGGDIINYQHFKYLDPSKNIFAIRSNGISEPIIKELTIEKMANDYWSEIESLNLKKRISIVGGSMGGVVAFEIARLLETKNMKVKQVIILDTYFPYRNSLKTFFLIQLKFCYYYLRLMLSFEINHYLKYQIVELRNLLSLFNYYPAPLLHTPLLLIKGTLNPVAVNANDWKRYCLKDFQVHYIETKHENMVESYRLFEYMRTILRY
ncbi:MAG: hypothetical protein CME63_02765 [Halobacteriovoraceae bacterium]|nr:hypothetical protein [Halobacteriovoraceae bacterium]|tara:strand:- start:34501 stop:38586 length:4086 start_codon:yes stop_codon:yes gene_type:complete